MEYKKRNRTSIVLTALLIFMFAVFGGGTILSAVGIIPQFSLFGNESTSSEVSNSSKSAEPKAAEVTPKDIHIYTPESPVSDNGENDGNDDERTALGNDKNNTNPSYVVELVQKTNPSSGSEVNSGSETSSPESKPDNTSSTPTPPDNSSTPTPLPYPDDVNRPDRGGSSGSSSKKVTSVLLDQADVTINRSNTLLLTATVAPANATNKAVTWASSKPEVASVDANGQVTALSAGTTAISAKAGNITAVCDVTVIVLMDGVSLNHEQLALPKGRSEQLVAKITPEDTTEDKTAIWVTSDPSIAAVDDKGKVTGVSVGTTKITATINGISTSCEVTVTLPLEGISVDKSTLVLQRSSSSKLTVSYLPGDTTDNKDITWSSSDATIADVDQQGNVTALIIGSAVITAKVGDFTTTSTVTVTAPLQGITIDKTTLTINRTKSDTLTVSYLPGDTTDSKDIIWSSSNPSVADVDQQGKVIAYNTGYAVITAAVGKYSAICEVTVIALIDGIYLDQSSMTLDRYTDKQLTAQIEPEDTTEDKTVTWASSNPNIATVDTTGKVTAVSAGDAIITAKVGKHTATCEVTVVTLIHSISLNKSIMILDRGTIEQLTVAIDPEDTTESKTVNWSTANPSIASVDLNGKVTAVGIGTTTITATVGQHTATCEVTVVALIHSISLDKSNVTLDRGTNEQLTVSIEPADTTEDKTVTWTSSNSAIATVDASGKVTAVAAGTATTTATVGEHTATCEVTVVTLIHSISLDKSSMTLDRGTNGQLIVSIDPADTTEDKTVIWTSSNPTIATVDASGKVTAVTAGTATITATVGTHTSACSIRVKDIYTISTAVSGNGTATGGGNVIEDNSITLKATPATGHHFLKWVSSAGESQTTASFTYVPTASVAWTAYFEIDKYDSTEVALPSNPTGGTGKISPAAPYTYGQTVTYTATPAAGYNFVKWTSNYGDVKTTASFTWQLTRPITWTPVFEGKMYTVTTAAVSPEKDPGGTVTGAGEYRYGSTITLKATPSTYFSFVNWTNNFGETATTPTLSYKFNAAAANAGGVTWTANFKLNAMAVATSSRSYPFDCYIWMNQISMTADFSGDSYESADASITLKLIEPIDVIKGQQLLSMQYETGYWAYANTYGATVNIYDTENKSLLTQSFSFKRGDKSEYIDYSATANATAKIDRIVFYAKGRGKYKNSTDETGDIWFDISNIKVGGQSLTPISGYNRPK